MKNDIKNYEEEIKNLKEEIAVLKAENNQLKNKIDEDKIKNKDLDSGICLDGCPQYVKDYVYNKNKTNGGN